jgi:PAS domain S-box-containing protein
MDSELAERLDRFDPLVLDRSEEDEAKHARLATDWLLRNLLETVPALLWASAPDGRLCYVNQRVVDYTGRTLADLVSLGWEDLIHPDDHGRVVATRSHAVRTGSSYQLSDRVLRADGEYRRVLVQGAPLLDREGRVIQIFGFGIDIDENTRVAEALRHAQEKLAQTLRNPAVQAVAAISGKTEIALAGNAREFGEMKDLGVKLSARERAIVRMMGHGLSNKGIARQLSIAPETVKSHAKSIFWKLTVRSRAEAVYRAAALGLI